MLYEYDLKPNISEEDIKNIISNNKTLSNKYFNQEIFLGFISIFILLFIYVTFISYFSISIMIITYFFCMVIISFFILIMYSMLRYYKNNRYQYIVNLTKKNWNKKRTIEVIGNTFIYSYENLKITFTKNDIIEVIKSKEYTFIFIDLRILKYFFPMQPVIIPNNLLECEEKLNKLVK